MGNGNRRGIAFLLHHLAADKTAWAQFFINTYSRGQVSRSAIAAVAGFVCSTSHLRKCPFSCHERSAKYSSRLAARRTATGSDVQNSSSDSSTSEKRCHAPSARKKQFVGQRAVALAGAEKHISRRAREVATTSLPGPRRQHDNCARHGLECG